MFLSDFSIKRPLVVVVIALGLMIAGWLAITKLRVNERPDVTFPLLNISLYYPGASPETIEREVTERIDKTLRSISGVHEMRVWITEGYAAFNIEFEFSKNMIEAADEVRNAIASVRHKLPTELREPVIRRQDPDAWPIISLSLSSSTQDLLSLSQFAERDLADRLRALPGVAIVNVSGGQTRQLTVHLRSEKLRMHGISVAEVQRTLRANNLNMPSGKISGPIENVSIRLMGRVASPQDFAAVVLRHRGDEILRLGDVADIQDGAAEPWNISFYNGKASVGVNIIRTRDASTVSVSNAVRTELDELRKTLAPGTEIEIANDGGLWAKQSLYNVIESLILGAVLTIFVVYVFLNSWRSTLITALALPTSVLAAFIAVWLFGFSLNFMTLLGLSLAIGVLIDDAIVVRENIVRHMEQGLDRYTAAKVGTQEIAVAVMATTFSIVAVFIPVAFMGSGPGQWFKPFALTVVASVVVSLFISFTLDPMLSSRWGDPVGYQHLPKRGFSALLQRFNIWFDTQANRYSFVIRWALHHRRTMAVLAVFSLVAAIVLQVQFGGSSFLPASDDGRLVVNIRMPPGISLEYARIKTAQAAEIARQIPEVKSIFSDIKTDNCRIDLDINSSRLRERSASVIAADLRKQLTVLIGAEYTVQDDTNNGGEKPVYIAFYGKDTRTLMEITNTYMENLRKIKGAVDVGLTEQVPMQELKVELNRSLASQLGISAFDAAQALQVAFAGLESGDWVDPNGETRDLYVILHPEDRKHLNALAQLPLIAAASGTLIPLQQIADIRMDKAPSRINHTNGKRTVAVAANVQGVPQGEVIDAAMKLAKAIDFPQGYGIELGGAGRDQQEVFGAMITALLSGIALMYFILVMQFGSFLAPVPVMLSLPLSLVGVVLALLTTGHTLNLMSLIGVIMLMGLVAKNAILLLDCARALEQQGLSREQALMTAGRLRLRPIVMTTFALIAGMLPVAIGLGEGGEFYQPLAVAIIGGVLTSTVLTLLMIPTFYDGFQSCYEAMQRAYLQRLNAYSPFTARLLITLEALLTLVFIRFVYRVIRMGLNTLFRKKQRL